MAQYYSAPIDANRVRTDGWGIGTNGTPSQSTAAADNPNARQATKGHSGERADGCAESECKQADGY